MSDDQDLKPEKPDHGGETPIAKIEEKIHRIEEKVHRIEAEVKRSLATRIGRGVAWTIGGMLALVLILVMSAAWYTTTDDFQHRVQKEVVKVLEDATGGRVELGSIRFSLRHLTVVANGLVIHGLEGPGEAPYLSAERIELRIELFNFLQHTAGVRACIACFVELSAG